MKNILLILLFITSYSLADCAYAQRVEVDYYKHKHLIAQSGYRIGGKEFIKSMETASFLHREGRIVEEILSGNVPDSLKFFKKIVFVTSIVDSVEVLKNEHIVEIHVLPDYLSIGTNNDFIRIPMGPLSAQIIADSQFCTLPTAYLVDKIAIASEGRIEPFPFRPIKDRNIQPAVFEESNNAINALYRANGYHFGQLISGLKKDVILTYKIMDPNRRNHVTIYGWHYPDGGHIQPSNNIHVNFYVDYSHGIRLISRYVKIDGKEYDIKSVLEEPNMYRLLSDEPFPMKSATYAGDIVHEGLSY